MVVLGLGDTGLSMAKWLTGQGAAVIAADTRLEPPRAHEAGDLLPRGALRLGPFSDELFAGIDLVAASPGVPLAEPALARAIQRGTSCVGDIELLAGALREYPRSRVLAVTGTNGKSTVTALTGEMCAAAGLDCEVAGNIGPAVLDVLSRREQAQMPQAWVLELSSFQLETTSSLEPDAATVLNISEDHLDRYASVDEYAATKARIFAGEGVRVVNRDDARSLAMAGEGRVLSFGLNAPRKEQDLGLVERSGRIWLTQGSSRLIALDEMKIAGLHNAANALAALALARSIELPWPPLLAALRDFRGLPHRVELVGEAAGVRYYDDSKGTNVGSTVAALSGLGAQGMKLVLIAGGEGKGQDFSPLAEAVRQSARSVVLIGRDAPAIERVLAGIGVPLRHASDMDEAVEVAAADARPGDAVLLSPACASFDMFRNYKHRGEVFRAAVRRRSPC